MNAFLLKNGRFYIYASLSLIIITYNFFFELKFSSLQEAVLETLVLFPMVFFFILLILKAREKILNLTYFKKFSDQRSIYKNLLIIGIIALKSFLITVVSRTITMLAFQDKDDELFFNLLFLTILLSVVVVIIFIYFFEEYLEFIQERHKMAMEISRYESEKVLMKYHSLKKQLNPHFLFNSFNSLITLIPVNPRNAEKFAEELSNIYRYNLSHSDELVVKLADELNMIQSYIHLQKIRFGEALVYKEELKMDKNKVLLPPMTLQILIENAIKHNKATKTSPLEITVYSQNNRIVVRNNLKTKEDIDRHGNDSFGIGMNSLKSQLRIITNEPLQIEKDAAFFTVHVPLINTELYD